MILGSSFRPPVQAQTDSLTSAEISDLRKLLSCIKAISVTGRADSLPAYDVVFEGCNVHVRNSLGRTDRTNGVGNLIVGYNEDDVLFTPDSEDGDFGTNDRSGSHNVVIGPEHAYSSYGGLVAGIRNTISGSWASVSGGGYHKASGLQSSVSGVREHTAAGPTDWRDGSLFEDE